MSGSEDSTRPLSVAELLARNGTIGAPPVGGRRRRRRRNSDGVSVAELTGEIPVVRTGEIPVIAEYDLEDAADYAAEDAPEYYVEDAAYEQVQYEEVEYEQVQYEEVQYEEVAETYAEAEAEADSGTNGSSFTIEEAPVEAVVYEPEPTEDVIYAPADVSAESVDRTEAPPRASDPLPRRSRGSGLELGHDPRPQRRSSGAEQMAYDPVDQSVDLSELVEQHGAEELRSYLQASSGTLFSGGTVADDLARRGFGSEPGADYDASAYDRSEYDPADRDAAPVTLSASAAGGPSGIAGGVWNGLVALLQSLLAVALGAGLFIGFDHLWHWNKLVALVLTVLVVLSLAAGVRVVRKTEDIVSTLTAVAVGLLVTLGPLALQST